MGSSDREELVIASAIWTLYHELGHALVSSYDLEVPLRGEEDYADEFATLMLLDAGRQGEILALQAAGSFDTGMSEDEELVELLIAPFDEHSLDSERLANMRCWIHGQSPKRHRALKRELGSRAAGCDDELDDIRDTWAKNLEPFLQNGHTLLQG